MGRVLPLDRPVPGLVWFLSVPGTWEKSKDQEIFGEEQSLESPALAPSFRGAEGLVTPPSPPGATGDARVSVQPQGAHAPTYLRRGAVGGGAFSSSSPQRSKTPANPRSTCLGKEGSRTVSRISSVARALPIFTCGQGRLGFAAGDSVPRLGQNSRMKKPQEEGRGDAKYPDRGVSVKGRAER